MEEVDEHTRWEFARYTILEQWAHMVPEPPPLPGLTWSRSSSSRTVALESCSFMWLLSCRAGGWGAKRGGESALVPAASRYPLQFRVYPLAVVASGWNLACTCHFPCLHACTQILPPQPVLERDGLTVLLGSPTNPKPRSQSGPYNLHPPPGRAGDGPGTRLPRSSASPPPWC